MSEKNSDSNSFETTQVFLIQILVNLSKQTRKKKQPRDWDISYDSCWCFVHEKWYSPFDKVLLYFIEAWSKNFLIRYFIIVMLIMTLNISLVFLDEDTFLCDWLCSLGVNKWYFSYIIIVVDADSAVPWPSTSVLQGRRHVSMGQVFDDSSPTIKSVTTLKTRIVIEIERWRVRDYTSTELTGEWLAWALLS